MAAKFLSHSKDRFRQYGLANRRLAQGKTVYVKEDAGGLVGSLSNRQKDARPIGYPRVGIYVGSGASHSWLWLVELCEAISCFDITFLDEENVKNGALGDLDVFFIGGGDTFAIAEALHVPGAKELRCFVESGGVYMGSCAGAYLLLALSGPPFEPFAGITAVEMANVSLDLPRCICMPTKFSSPYSGMYVVHPVRESVLLRMNQSKLLCQDTVLTAPLYGGPAMIPSDQETAFAWYYGFTEDTLFLGTKDLAEELLLGNAAVIRKECGPGTIWLFGTHCEHPEYLAANQAMVTAMYAGLGKRHVDRAGSAERDKQYADCTLERELLKDIKKHVSNARIVALGMESASIHWIIGKKSYEPEKIRVFLEGVWERLLNLMKQGSFCIVPSELEIVRDYFSIISRDVTTLAQGVQGGDETTPIAERLFSRLKEGTAAFLDVYFKNRLFYLTR